MIRVLRERQGVRKQILSLGERGFSPGWNPFFFLVNSAFCQRVFEELLSGISLGRNKVEIFPRPPNFGLFEETGAQNQKHTFRILPKKTKKPRIPTPVPPTNGPPSPTARRRFPKYESVDDGEEIDMASLLNRGDQPDGVRAFGWRGG